MKKNHKKCQNWVNIYLFVFFSLFLSLHNPTMIRAEVNNSTDEYETISLQEANIDNNHSDSADLFTEGPESSLPSETNSDNEVIGEGLPEKDMIVGGDSLTEEQNVTRLSGESIEDIHKVNTFDELKVAIENAGNKQTTIKIMESFTLTEALTIGQDQDITLTADNDQVKEKWQPIERPADYADQGEAKQREIIEEGRRRGEEALEKANLEANPLPSEDKNKIIKRAKEFVEDTLFKVFGKLTLGTDNSAIYIDGNGDEARTKFDNRGSVIDVNGELVMKNAVIMNSYNSHGYTAPIRVNDGGEFTMEGGRITKNTSFEQVDLYYTRPTAAGAVYVKPGGTFTMTNGLIDNNHGGLTGGVFAGDLFGSEKHPAEVTINGGIIAKNESRTGYQMGGGLNGFPKSKLTITDGIIAGNKSSGPGGGVGISSQYIGSPSNVLGAEKASVNRNYKEFIKTNKAEAIIDGGLIYENRAGTSGGGVYLDSNDVNFGRTMVLDNRASQFGGGIYASFPPITQKLENILITENRALGEVTSSIIGGSNGGGLWNCPTGFVHIGDGHSVYVYNNDSGSYGKDITFSEKTRYFNLNDVNIKDEFYSHISPVTKEKNIIKFLEDGPNKEKGVEIPDRLSYHSLYTHLKSIYSQNLIEEAWRNSQTFVLGNQANNGGGFGSNANVTTPKDEGEYGIEVNKKWDDRIEKHTIPMEIKADLFIVPLDKDEKYVKSNYGKDNSLFKYGEITLSEDNNWHSRFDTNYFNGANKEEILKKLEINNFSDIGLPDDAYQMDRGLPFTAEELAERGYKYLVLEQGDRYFVEYDEEKPAKEKTEKAGVLEVYREYNAKYDDEVARGDRDLFFYFYDPERQTLTRIGQTTIHEEKDENGNGKGFGKASIAHPLLLKKVSEYKDYGAYRKFKEYEGWDDVEGYHNKDKGYAIILTENEDGTLTVEVPYLWLDDYYYDVGFSARQLDNTQDYIVKGNKTHSFTLTNSPWGQLDVEKSWKNIKEKDQPKSMDFYVLLDGKRVVDSYDDKGNPIYKKLTLKAEDDWKGSLDKLDPKSLAAGRYSLEEDSDIFAPEFINKKQEFTIRIGYADNFHEEGQADNHVTATNNHFRSYIYKNEDGTMKGIKMNLYLDGKKVDSKEFTFTVDYMPEVDFTYYYLKDNVVFKELEVETFGQAIPVKYYDLISNEPGLYEYNFYLKRDESGAYALYLPRLVINGVPYADLFIAEKLEPNPPYDSHERINSILPLESKDDWQIEVENHQGPTHEIEILKQWIGGESKVPDEITVVITNEKNEVQKIKLTKEGNWQKTLDNLEGTLRHKGYSIKEVEVPGFTGEIKTEKAGLKITSKDKNGQEIILNYIDDELKTVLKDGNYRYEVFELEDNDLDFSDENRESFITLETQNDGRYVIRYANGIKLTEILTFKLTNKHIPSRDLHVTKAWNLVGTEHPVEAIEVELYRNGEATGQTLTLSASNEWQGMFTNLPIGNPTDSTEYQYTVKEVGEVKGRIQFGERQFDVTYTGSMGGGLMITNQEIERTRDLHVTKAWNLVGTEHPVEAIEVELYRNGEATGQTLTLSASNEWQGMFTNLPIGNPTDSTEYQYTVKEVGEVKGRIQFGERQFDVTYTGSMGGGLMITNQEIERTRDLHVTKAWNLVGTEHPVEAIEVELYRNGEATGQTLTLSASNEWQGMFTNLPIGNPTDSTEYQYTVKEVGEVKGRIQFGERQFDVTYTGSMGGGLMITNQEIERTRDLHVTKAWNLVGTEHPVEAIEVELYRNGEATGQTLTLSASNEWQGMFTNLPIGNPTDSTEYQYTVKEVGEVKGRIQFGERQFDVTYTGSMGGGLMITNQEIERTRDLHVTKAWNLVGTEHPVEAIEVELYRNGEATGQTLTLSASNEWQGMFTNLPIGNPTDSTEYQYTVKEVGEVKGRIQFGERQFDVTYTGSMGGGLMITNQEIERTRDLHVTKAWNLVGTEHPVEAIEVELYRNGEATGQTLTLSASNEWQGMFTNLPIGNPTDSTEYQYTVKEVGEVKGRIQFGERQFDVTYTGSMGGGLMITNQEIERTRDLHVTKAWNLVGTEHPVEAIEVELYRNGEATGQTLTLSASNEWQGMFTNLPIGNPTDSTEYQYTVKEVGEVKGRIQFGERQFDVTYTGSMGGGLMITNQEIERTRDLHVTKAWNLVGTEHPVEAIEVELYRNGEATGQTLTLSASNEWQGMFTNLPIGNPTDSTEYQYTVKEVGEVKGRIQFGERQFDVTYTGSMGGGLMITNQEIERTRDLHVTKAWNLVGTEHPVEAIEVELYRNGEATGQTLTLSASNEWQGMFTNLPIGNPTDSTEYQYTVKEVGEVKGRIQFGERQFDVTYTGSMGGGLMITNQEIERTRDLHVTKAWNLVGTEHPVEAIEVELYRNGEATGQTLTLSASNEWQGMFTNLPIGNPTDSTEYQYTVKEVGEVKGRIQFGERQFDVTYTGTMADGFTITNKEKPNTPPDIPEEPGKPEEPPTPPETPKEPPVPEIPRKQLPPTGENILLNLIATYMIIIGSLVLLIVVSRNKKFD